MKLSSILYEVVKNDVIKKFIKFVVKELGLKTMPDKINITNDPKFTTTNRTFGTYEPQKNQITVYFGNRHIADSLRTLAHELVHHKQREDNKNLDGNDGSEIENEANAVAGELMRKFRKIYPDLYL